MSLLLARTLTRPRRSGRADWCSAAEDRVRSLTREGGSPERARDERRRATAIVCTGWRYRQRLLLSGCADRPASATFNAMNTLPRLPIEARPDDIHRDARREAAALDSARSAADPGRADGRVQSRLKPRTGRLHLRSAGAHRCDRAHAGRAATARRPTDRTDYQPTRGRSQRSAWVTAHRHRRQPRQRLREQRHARHQPAHPHPSEVAVPITLPSSAHTTSSM